MSNVISDANISERTSRVVSLRALLRALKAKGTLTKYEVVSNKNIKSVFGNKFSVKIDGLASPYHGAALAHLIRAYLPESGVKLMSDTALRVSEDPWETLTAVRADQFNIDADVAVAVVSKLVVMLQNTPATNDGCQTKTAALLIKSYLL